MSELLQLKADTFDLITQIQIERAKINEANQRIGELNNIIIANTEKIAAMEQKDEKEKTTG